MADLRPVVTDDLPAPQGSLDLHAVAPGIVRLRTVFVNIYVVETADGGFVLIDTGMAHTASFVKRALASRYGENARPRAILLTHAHVDHVGNAKALAEAYDVPVYVHPLEKPYVTGRSDYPPADPTPGGAIAFFARALPTRGTDLGARVKTLPKDGSVPELRGWRWVHTPGHSVGHVSFYREVDRVLIAGDALATTDMDGWIAINLWPRRLSRPALPFTPDWEAARASVFLLADLEPTVVAAGHGKPIEADDLGDRLRELANAIVAPAGGRYSGRPATYKANGAVAAVPPPRPDPLPKKLIVTAAVALIGTIVLKRRR